MILMNHLPSVTLLRWTFGMVMLLFQMAPKLGVCFEDGSAEGAARLQLSSVLTPGYVCHDGR